jgi:hypothetical protein
VRHGFAAYEIVYYCPQRKFSRHQFKEHHATADILVHWNQCARQFVNFSFVPHKVECVFAISISDNGVTVELDFVLESDWQLTEE